MILKISGALVASLLILAIAYIFFAQGDNSNQGKNQEPKPEAAVAEEWDGRGEHIYNMDIPDFSAPGALRIEKASFSGLRGSQSTVIVRMQYSGNRLPAWLSPKRRDRSFAALYQSSDDRANYQLAVGPLEDGVAVIDFTIKGVPSVRLNSFSRKGLFMFLQGPLRRGAPFFLRISATPQPGYALGGR